MGCVKCNKEEEDERCQRFSRVRGASAIRASRSSVAVRDPQCPTARELDFPLGECRRSIDQPFDCKIPSEPRPIQPPEMGSVVAVPQVGDRTTSANDEQPETAEDLKRYFCSVL